MVRDGAHRGHRHVKHVQCNIEMTKSGSKKPPNKGASKSRKATIPKALREQVWCDRFGRAFAHKCSTRWCSNTISVFDFQIGHDIPESKGGTLAIANLIPICSRCNSSMSNTYSFKEWERLSTPVTGLLTRLFNWTRNNTSRVKDGSVGA